MYKRAVLQECCLTNTSIGKRLIFALVIQDSCLVLVSVDSLEAAGYMNQKMMLFLFCREVLVVTCGKLF